MKKLLAIFAHPDDEAFGPGGTLASYATTHDVYIICATRGESGQNHHSEDRENIGTLREQELQESAKLLGVKKVFFLGYTDGTLSNAMYHDIADSIQKIADELQPEIFLTFDEKGVSGHLDHVAITMITNYVFERTSYVKKLMMYGILREESEELRKDYFIYVPFGYRQEEFDEIVDISDVYNLKVEAMKKHRSQMKDVNRILQQMEKLPQEEYFFARSK